MPVRDVIITGAGASAADNLPMQAKLFRRFWENQQSALSQARKNSRQHSPATTEDEWHQVLLDLASYLQNFFGIDVGCLSNVPEPVFPTFEEALGILDLALADQEEFWDWSERTIRDTRFNLVALIASTLLDSEPRAGQNHLRLIKNLARLRRLQTTAFVTTNYDRLLDQALEHTVGRNNTDYGVAFRYAYNEPLPALNDSAVRVLKIHGSLDWLYCACCRTLDRDDIRRVIPGQSEGTPFCACGNVKRAVIVPPSFVKSLSNAYLAKLWATAEQVISDAERLIFCGYSFPDADLNFKYLLKRAQLRSQSINNSLSLDRHGEPVRPEQRWQTIVVINNHPGKKEELKKEEAERFCRFFGSGVEVIYTEYSFEEFSRNPSVVDRKRSRHATP